MYIDYRTERIVIFIGPRPRNTIGIKVETWVIHCSSVAPALDGVHPAMNGAKHAADVPSLGYIPDLPVACT